MPSVYNRDKHKDRDAKFLKPLFGKTDGYWVPYFMVGCTKGPAQLEADDPRHFRCDDPTVIVALAGRTSDKIKARGAYRPPVPERAP